MRVDWRGLGAVSNRKSSSWLCDLKKCVKRISCDLKKCVKRISDFDGTHEEATQ
jgi:hypothetical protein